MTHTRPEYEPFTVVAHRLGLPPSYLKAEVLAGRLPGLLIGRRWICSYGQVKEVLQARTCCWPYREKPEPRGEWVEGGWPW